MFLDGMFNVARSDISQAIEEMETSVCLFGAFLVVVNAFCFLLAYHSQSFGWHEIVEFGPLLLLFDIVVVALMVFLQRYLKDFR